MFGRNGTILISTMLSLFFGFLGALLFTDDLSWWKVVILALVLSLLSPLIGKVFVSVGLRLCNAIDKVFSLPGRSAFSFRWGNWPADTQMLLAATWPITGPVIVVLASIALVFGQLFKSLFKQDEAD